jgi:phage terminase small subunit
MAKKKAKKKSKTAKHRQPKGAAGSRRRGKAASERPLTKQQERFAIEAAKGACNGKEAATRAGYAPRYADRQASQLLDNPRVAARIKEIQAKAAERAEIEAAVVIQEWGRLSLSDIRDVLEVTERGVRVKPSSQWPEGAARAVAEVSETVTESGGTVRVKLHPKLGALDSLGKYLGLLVDRRKVEHTGKGGGPIHVQQEEDLSPLSVEELKALRDIRDKLDAAKGTGKPSSD